MKKLEERYEGIARLDNLQREQQLTAYYHVSGFEHPKLPIITNRGVYFMTWGLIPSFYKTFEHNPEVNLLNAKQETIFDLTSFRGPSNYYKFGILSINGFFESEHREGRVIPWFIYDRYYEYLSVGVVYDEWQDKETREIKRSFAIVTTEADEFMGKIHNTKKRMPLILPQANVRELLYPPSRQRLIELLKHQYGGLEAHTITKNINNSRVHRNREDYLNYVEYKDDDTDDYHYGSKKAKARR